MTRRIETLTYQESDELLEYLQTHPKETGNRWKRNRNYAIAVIMLDAGLRVGEVVQLRIRDLIYNSLPVKSIIIDQQMTKNKEPREIPVSDRLYEALKFLGPSQLAYKRNQAAAYAFHTRNWYSPMTPRQIQYIIGNASRHLWNKKVHPHILRHTFGTRLAKKVNLRVVQALLGHKSITSTQIYVHPDSDDLKNAINNFNGETKPAPS